MQRPQPGFPPAAVAMLTSVAGFIQTQTPGVMLSFEDVPQKIFFFFFSLLLLPPLLVNFQKLSR